MLRITEFVLRRPLVVLVILLGITLFFGIEIAQNARIETDLDAHMPQEHEAFVLSNQYEEIFGIRDAVVVAVENREGIYHPSTLTKVNEISRRLGELDEIVPGSVRSLATADNIVGSDFGLEISPFYSELPQSEAEVRSLRVAVESNEMIWGRMVSRDGQATLISAEVSESSVDHRALYGKVMAIVSEYDGPEKFYVAGQPVVEGTLAHLMPDDMKKMVPIVVLVILVVLVVTLRSLKSTLLTLGVVLFSTVWAFGLMAYLGIPVYSVSTMIPVMLIALGVADGIHLLSHLSERMRQNPGVSVGEAVTEMIGHLWKPVAMTSLTTAVGFVSLITSEVYPIKYFGLFTAFGVMAAMVFSLLFIPAGLAVLRLPRLAGRSAEQSGDGKRTVFFAAATAVLKGKKMVVIVSLMAVALGIVGLQRVWIDSSLLSTFDDSEEIVQADQFINEHFAGTTNLNVVFVGEGPDDLKNPRYLQDLWRLQTELEQLPEVGGTFGINDFLRRINKVVNEDREEFNRVPDDQDLIAQYLLLYSMSGDPEELDGVIDYDYRRVNLQVNTKGSSAQVIRRVLDRIDEFVATSSLRDLKVDYAGSAYTSMVFTDLILEGQINSLLISTVLLVLLLGLMFRSVAAGLLGTLPIIITAIINFGIMGFTGISLNTSTALISSIAMGMGIDYSIHLLSQYQRYGVRVSSSLEVAQKVMNLSGRAITFNALVVVSGFMVLMTSGFPLNRRLGLLVSLSMFISFVCTLTVVVALIDWLKPRFIFGKTKPTEGVSM